MLRSESRLPQLRITVNSRCGRRCIFCRPAGEAIPTVAGARLDAETVVRVSRAVAVAGIRDVKLTGGDPALWTPLVECVRRLKGELGVGVQVISRHPRLGVLAPSLAEAGIDLFNVSLDTLDPSLHRQITGRGDLEAVLSAIRACIATGVPVKVNTVVMAGKNEREIGDLIAFCEREGVQTIKLLDVIRDLDRGSESYAGSLGEEGMTLAGLYKPLADVVERVRSQAVTSKTSLQGGLGHPMTSLVLRSGLEVLVKDHNRGAWYGSVCKGCPHYPCHDALMALRVTADARLQFCLLREDKVIDLKPLLADGDPSLQEAIDAALAVYLGAEFHAVPTSVEEIVPLQMPRTQA